MLRTGEVLDLLNSHIAMTRSSHVAVISLGLTKGGKRQGAYESTTLGVEPALNLLWKWKKSNPVKGALCPAAHKWREKFSTILSELNLQSYGFRPYSLRRGGATHWFRHHGSFDKILVQGRWAAPRAAKLYINEGLALLAELRIPLSPYKAFLAKYHRSTQWSQKLEQLRRAGGRGEYLSS